MTTSEPVIVRIPRPANDLPHIARLVPFSREYGGARGPYRLGYRSMPGKRKRPATSSLHPLDKGVCLLDVRDWSYVVGYLGIRSGGMQRAIADAERRAAEFDPIERAKYEAIANQIGFDHGTNSSRSSLHVWEDDVDDEVDE
jgi:hypothetical protein